MNISKILLGFTEVDAKTWITPAVAIWRLDIGFDESLLCGMVSVMEALDQWNWNG